MSKTKQKKQKEQKSKTKQNTATAAYPEISQEDKTFLCIIVQNCELLPLKESRADCERGQRVMAKACGSDNWWKVSVSVTCC